MYHSHMIWSADDDSKRCIVERVRGLNPTHVAVSCLKVFSGCSVVYFWRGRNFTTTSSFFYGGKLSLPLPRFT